MEYIIFDIYFLTDYKLVQTLGIAVFVTLWRTTPGQLYSSS